MMNTLNITIENTKTYLHIGNQAKACLPIGYQQISNDILKNQFLPSSYQIEMAIIAIEDAIMAHPLKSPNHLAIILDNPWINTIYQIIGIKTDKIINRDRLEHLFNRVTDIIMGSPMHNNELPMQCDFISYLLILREIMHHLNIETVMIK